MLNIIRTQATHHTNYVLAYGIEAYRAQLQSDLLGEATLTQLLPALEEINTPEARLAAEEISIELAARYEHSLEMFHDTPAFDARWSEAEVGA